MVCISSTPPCDTHTSISKYVDIVTSSLNIIIPPRDFMINTFGVIKQPLNQLLHSMHYHRYIKCHELLWESKSSEEEACEVQKDCRYIPMLYV